MSGCCGMPGVNPYLEYAKKAIADGTYKDPEFRMQPGPGTWFTMGGYTDDLKLNLEKWDADRKSGKMTDEDVMRSELKLKDLIIEKLWRECKAWRSLRHLLDSVDRDVLFASEVYQSMADTDRLLFPYGEKMP